MAAGDFRLVNQLTNSALHGKIDASVRWPYSLIIFLPSNTRSHLFVSSHPYIFPPPNTKSNDWIPCKRDKTKTHACLKDLVAIAEKGRNIVITMSFNAIFWSNERSTTVPAFLQTTIKQFATLHPALSKSFAIATWLNSEEEKGAITKHYLTEINSEFKFIHTTLDAIDNAINEESKTKNKISLDCDADINTAIEQLRNIKINYDLAVNGDNNGRNDFIKNGCPVLERSDKSFYMLIGTLLRPKSTYMG